MKKLITSAFLLLNAVCFSEYYSQVGQDKFVNENYFKNMKGGVFVDIGAHNGVMLSNTYFFEQQGWTGICIEPIPDVYDQLIKNRKCNCVKGCVTDRSGGGQLLKINTHYSYTEMLSGLVDKYDPQHLERILKEVAYFGATYEIINVKCFLLNELLEKYEINHINFLSIDTEGGEFDIISTIDFDRYLIDVITLEDNYHDPRFIPFLEKKGFVFVRRIEFDAIFVRKDFLSSLGTTNPP